MTVAAEAMPATAAPDLVKQLESVAEAASALRDRAIEAVAAKVTKDG